MSNAPTFDQAILVQGENARSLVQAARGEAFSVAAPGYSVHFSTMTRELFGPIVVLEILLILIDNHSESFTVSSFVSVIVLKRYRDRRNNIDLVVSCMYTDTSYQLK